MVTPAAPTPAPTLSLNAPATGSRTFALLNDEPVGHETLDLLGARRAATQLTGLLVASRHATPLTLAVDAGWGMGKSSLMRLVDAQLRRHPQVHTVWYNAWTSTGADALEGLIKSVLLRVDPNILRRALRRINGRGALLRLARAVTVLAAGPLGVAGMVDELWRTLSLDATARNGMRDALREVVGEWVAAAPDGAPDRLLVVFIDDLDRCSEETVLAVCEAVKVYLDVPGLSFVVGCDRSAIGPEGLLRDLSPAGAAFMEKIFQTSYRIPAASGPDIHSYVRWCARRAGIDHLLDDYLVELLAFRAARNPRRVKRLVNGLLLEAALNPIWDDVTPEAVIRTLLLQYLYPDFYRMMTVPAGPGDGDVVRQFLTYRRVRTELWSGAEWSDETALLVTDFLRTYEVWPVTAVTDRSRALTDLEQQLPTGFPALAADPAFTSLLNELMALPESQTVQRRLREGLDAPPADPVEAEPVRPAPGPVDEDEAEPEPEPAPWAAIDREPVPAQRQSQPAPQQGFGYPQQGYSGYPNVSPALEEDPAGSTVGSQGPEWYGQSSQPAPATWQLPEEGGRPVVGQPTIAVVGFDPRSTSRLHARVAAVGGAALDMTDAPPAGDTPSPLTELAALAVNFDRRDLDVADTVEGWRSRVDAGPVFLYTSRVTPARTARSQELRGMLVDDLDRLADALSQAVAPRAESPAPAAPAPAVPSVPPGPASGGRPR